MLDYISKQLKARLGTEDTSASEENQMNEAVLEYCHLFQELDDLTMNGTEEGSSRPYTKIDIPLENDIEIDSVELNLLDGRVTDIPTDATVQEHSVLYTQMKTFDEFYQEAYSSMTQYQRETNAQFANRVRNVAIQKFATYKNQLIQEGLFGFDKIQINDKSVPAKLTVDFGKLGDKGSYYVKLPIKYEVDKKHRILLKQLHSVHWIQNNDEVIKAITQLVYSQLGEKAGVRDEADLWSNITPVEIVVPIDPADQYCVAFGFEIDGSEKIEYIEWTAPVKGVAKNPLDAGSMIAPGEINKLNLTTKGKAVQEMAIPVRKPSRFFQEEIDFGNPDEAPATDPDAATVSVDAAPAEGAPAADGATQDTAPADGGTPAEGAPAEGAADKESVDPNDVSAEIADKIADDTQNTDNGDDINVDDVDMNASVGDEGSDTSVDDELNSLDDGTGEVPTDDTESTETSDIDFDNMTVEELLSQGSEKLKGMTIQQLRDFLNSPDGTPPPAEGEATQEAFFITRGNVGKELDIHLRKALGILNNNDMEIEELCDAFRKEGKQLNRVAHKASKMKKLFNETEIKQLQRLNACLSDLLSMMRSDIDKNSVMTVKRMIQAFVSEATGVAKMLEKRNNPGEAVQEAYTDLKKIRSRKQQYMSLSDNKIVMLKKQGLFDKLFGSLFKSKEDKTSKLFDNFPIDEQTLTRILDKIDKDTEKPCIELSFKQINPDDVKPDMSVLGGFPPYIKEIPVDHRKGQLRFLAQINLKDFDLEGFPKKGILQFWMEKELEYDDDAKIIYISDTSKPSISIDQIDKSIYTGRQFIFRDTDNENPSFEIQFKPAVSCLEPFSSDEINDYNEIFMKTWNEIVDDPDKKIESNAKAFDTLFMIPKEYWKKRDDSERNKKYATGSIIGGYPGFVQGDPRSPKRFTPENSVLLLQLDSDDHMLWGDCGDAQFFITKNELAKLNFNNVLFDWACY